MPLDLAINQLIEDLCSELRAVLTTELMTLRLPTGELRLGAELREDYPESLRTLDHAALLELLASADIAQAVPRRDERDWSDLGYRMFFITRLFRSYQERAELLQPPYTPAQLAWLKDGRMPPPPL